MTSDTPTPPLRKAEEVAKEVMSHGWAWQEMEATDNPSKSYTKGVRAIERDRREAMLWFGEIVRSRIASCGYETVMMDDITGLDLGELLREAAEEKAQP